VFIFIQGVLNNVTIFLFSVLSGVMNKFSPLPSFHVIILVNTSLVLGSYLNALAIVLSALGTVIHGMNLNIELIATSCFIAGDVDKLYSINAESVLLDVLIGSDNTPSVSLGAVCAEFTISPCHIMPISSTVLVGSLTALAVAANLSTYTSRCFWIFLNADCATSSLVA
jgi:hypothetical protein